MSERTVTSEELAAGIMLPTGMVHTLTLRPPVVIRLSLRLNGEPLGDTRYRFEAGGQTRKGMTDGGTLVEAVPAGVEEARLQMEDEEGQPYLAAFILEIAKLDPVNSIVGVQERLTNLGYNPGSIDGRTGPYTAAATRAFQAHNGELVDGVAGPKTQGELRDVYGY